MELVGRDREMAEIHAVIADARNGLRGVVVVEGDAGMGKTALVRAAVAAESARVIWVSGDDAELTLDHGIVDQMLRAAPAELLDRLDLAISPDHDAIQSGAALVGLVDRLSLASDVPLVVVVDDAQWADSLSLQALTFAARRIRNDPVVLIVTVRRDGLGHLPDGLRRLVDDEGVRIAVHPLDIDEVRLLTERIMGQPVGVASSSRLLEHTGGNPLHLVTLLEEITIDDVLSANQLPAPRSFSTLVLSRLARCDREVEALVSSVAVLGGSAELSIAAAVAGLDDPVAALDAALGANLLVADSSQSSCAHVSVSHPLVRAAVLGDLPMIRQSDLHRAAGEVVSGPAGMLHRLHGAVTPDERLWREAVACARKEGELGAHGTAATLLVAATRIAPGATAREETLLDAVYQLLFAGRIAEVADFVEDVRAASPSPRRSLLLGRLAYTIGPRHDTRTHVEAAWRGLVDRAGGEEGLGRLSGPERSLAAQVASMAAFNSSDHLVVNEVVNWCRFALDLDPQHAALASVAQALASGLALAGRMDEGISELDAMCSAAVSRGAPSVADTHVARGMLRLWTHDLAGAHHDFERGLREAERSASFVARETGRAYLAEVLYRQGRWDDAVLHAQTAVSLITDSDQDWMAALPQATLVRPLAARGDSAAAELLDRAAAAAGRTGSFVDAGFVCMSSIEAGACLRDHSRVLFAGELLSAAGVAAEHFGAWRASYVESLVALDRVDDAESVLSELEAQRPTALQATDLARAGVVLAAARGDGALVEEWAAMGLQINPESVGPYPRARLELACGRALRRAGERRRASDLLAQARERFEALGAVPWLEQVDREIAALGLHPVRRSERTGEELTPQEQAVAQLVGRGMKNREVAAELVISTKTVEHHLSRVYAKLGIRGRTELAHRLSTDGT